MGVNVWQLNTIIIHVVTLVPRPYQHGNETSIGIGVYLYAGHMVYMLQTEPPCLFTGDHVFVGGCGESFVLPRKFGTSVELVSFPHNSLGTRLVLSSFCLNLVTGLIL